MLEKNVKNLSEEVICRANEEEAFERMVQNAKQNLAKNLNRGYRGKKMDLDYYLKIYTRYNQMEHSLRRLIGDTEGVVDLESLARYRGL